MVGFADDTFNGTVQWLGQGTNSVGYDINGVWHNNAEVASTEGWAVGHRVLAIFDATSRRAWFKNLTTNSAFNGDPIAGTGGVVLTGTGAIKPCLVVDADATTVELDTGCNGVVLPSGVSAMAPTNLPARPLYVAKTGNDTTGTGASGAPYLTITKGLSIATAGQTVYVDDGVYAEVAGDGPVGHARRTDHHQVEEQMGRQAQTGWQYRHDRFIGIVGIPRLQRPRRARDRRNGFTRLPDRCLCIR